MTYNLTNSPSPMHHHECVGIVYEYNHVCMFLTCIVMGGEPDETSLSGLYDNLYAIRELWYSLGLKLGLTSATLDQIRQRSSSPKECLREVLRCWLQSDSVNRTPKTLCDALHSVTVGADQLAEELEKKYCLKSGGIRN